MSKGAPAPFEAVNNQLRRVWAEGRKPDFIRVRTVLLDAAWAGSGPVLAQLIKSKGVALRFYLLTLFDAQCRLAPEEEWNSTRALAGRNSWADFLALDGAYSSETGSYMRPTKQERDAQTLRVRQVQGALRTLEALGEQRRRALVEVPRKTNGRGRDYAAFSVMKESGRGDLQTPDRYTVPHRDTAERVSLVPVDFFLKGWVQVLHPSEVATWLVLLTLSQQMPGSHAASGVYLYANRRMERYGLRRDAYEDACSWLRAFGLLGPTPAGRTASNQRYQPNRHQISYEGLAQSALQKVLKEITIRKGEIRRQV
ncbi:hypothetical protein ABZ686_02270 [Streptomyces sp. NPDC006992]|uniref:hypothetical protein n=1 Tax=Streptomyces sp. NPDC006992 TaxID=3155601 RepID=UPI0033D7A111